MLKEHSVNVVKTIYDPSRGTGGTPPMAEARYYEDGTVPWFGPGSLDGQIAVSQPVKLLNESAVKEGAARMFAAGVTLVVTIGATLGKVSSLAKPGSCNQQITVIELDERRVHPRNTARPSSPPPSPARLTCAPPHEPAKLTPCSSSN